MDRWGEKQNAENWGGSECDIQVLVSNKSEQANWQSVIDVFNS